MARRVVSPKLTAVLAAFGVALLLSAAAHGANAVELLEAGRQLAEAGRLEDAIAVAEEGLEQTRDVMPEQPEVLEAYLHDDIARWKFELGRLEEARLSASRAVESARVGFGSEALPVVYFIRTQAELDNAAGDCRQAIARFSGWGERIGRYGTAGATYADALVDMARLHRQFSEPVQADVLLRAAAALSPLSDQSRLNIAEARMALALDAHDLGTAQQLLVEALSRNAGRAQPQAMLALMQARVARSQGDILRAAAGLEDFLRLNTGTNAAPLWSELGVLEGLRGRFASAEEHLQRAMGAYAHHSSLSPRRANLHHSLGWAYRWLGDLDRAAVHYDAALRGRESCSGGTDWSTANLLLQRARLRLQTGELTGALQDTDRARAIVSALAAPPPLAMAYVNHASGLVQTRLGRLDAARQSTLESIRTIEAVRGGGTEDLVPGYTHLAEIALLLGRAAEARDWAMRAVRIRERTGAVSFWGLGTSLSLLAAAEAADGAAPAELEATLRRFVDVSNDYLRVSTSAGGMIGAEVEEQRHALERVADTAGSRLTEDMLGSFARLMQLPHVSGAGSLAVGAALSARTASPALAAILAERVTAGERLRAQRTQLAELLGASDEPDREGALLQALLDQIDATRGIVRELNARLLESEPGLAALILPQTVELRSLAPLLGGREALLLQLVTDRYTHTLLLRGNGELHYRRTEIGKAVIRRHVGRLRRALDLALPLSERVPFDHAAAYELYQAAIAPVSDLLDGVSELIVVPDDAFQNLPWSVLRTSEPSDSSASQRGQFLIDRFALSTVPSPNIFRMLREARSVAPAPEPFIAFGDPVLGGRGAREARLPSTLIDDFLRGPGAADVSELTPLPHTAEELTALADVLGADEDAVKLGRDATQRAVHEADLERYRIVAFATHGLVAGDFRGLAEPALVLTPDLMPEGGRPDNGLLVASEIAGLRLNADLVILSACNTGRPDEQSGAAGLSALARSFMAAGARSLLVSHWSVSSSAAVPLIVRAVGALSSGANSGRAEALRAAMLWMKDGGAGERYRDPAYWGPFALVGSSGPIASSEGASL